MNATLKVQNKIFRTYAITAYYFQQCKGKPAAVKKSLTLSSYRSNLYLSILIKTFLLNLLSGGTNFDKATLSWGEF